MVQLQDALCFLVAGPLTGLASGRLKPSDAKGAGPLGSAPAGVPIASTASTGSRRSALTKTLRVVRRVEPCEVEARTRMPAS